LRSKEEEKLVSLLYVKCITSNRKSFSMSQRKEEKEKEKPRHRFLCACCSRQNECVYNLFNVLIAIDYCVSIWISSLSCRINFNWVCWMTRKKSHLV